MAKYSYAQLEQLWINGGGATSLAPVAAAIAEAESQGDPEATNPADNNGTQTSWGLWQISNGTHNQPVPNILDPSVNAQQAVAKYNASGWEPWGTYTSGAYTAYLSNSTPPDPSGVPAGGSGVTTTAAVTGPSPCLLSSPSVNLYVTTVGGGCLVSKSQGRAVIGGLCMVAGALIVLPGLIILVVSGFKGAGGPAAVAGTASVLGKVPVYGRAVRRLT